MSFSKARIQRFNELGSEAPPPGAYDPKFGTKVKGVAIEKTERFQDTKSVSSGSVECMSVSSNGADSTSGLKFKTPPVPRKRMIVKSATMSSSKVKSKLLIAAKDPKAQYDLQNELVDLKVECSNKDKTIQEQGKYIEEMKGKISEITKRLSELNKKCSVDEEQYKRDIESMVKLQQEVMEDQQEKHKMELDFLRKEIVEMANFKKEEIFALNRRENELEEELQTLRKTETELNQRIATLEIDISNFQGVEGLALELKKAEERLNELSTEMFEIIERKDQDFENLKEANVEIEEELNVVREEYEECQQRANEVKRNLENLKEGYEANLVSLKCKLASEVIDFIHCSLNPLNQEIKNTNALSEFEELGIKISRMIEGFKILKNQELEELIGKCESLERENKSEKSSRLEMENRMRESEEKVDFLCRELTNVQRRYKDLQQDKAKLEAANERQALTEETNKTELETLRRFHEEEQSKLKNLMEETRLEYLQQIENMSDARNHELKDMKEAMKKTIEEEKMRIKEHADKLVENAEDVTRETLAACRAESEERVKRMIAETDAKVNNILRDSKKSSEEEIRLATEKFATSSDCLEAENSALKENLTQKDSEINELKAALEELRSTAETQESFSQSLQAELDRAETELAGKKEELRSLKDHIRSEAAEMVSRRRRFEVVMSENQASVAALTNRLAQSDAEVKRLQVELEGCEASLREHRDLLKNAMQSNSKLLQEQVQTITDQLKEKESFIEQMEENCKAEIESIKTALHIKIENVMEETTEKVSRLQEDCSNKTKLNIELKQLLDKMAPKYDELQAMLLNLEEENDKQAIQISTLETINAKLKIKVKEQTTLVEEGKFHEKEAEEAKEAIKEMILKIESLETENRSLKEKMAQFEEETQQWKTTEASLIEDLEKETVVREKNEREMRVLSENFERLRSEYEELTEKYAEILGHHNNNQRIKHICKLKDKILVQQKDNLRLKQELEMKTNMIEQLTKNSEKTKLEEKRKLGKGKENLNSASYGKTTPTQKIRTNSVSIPKSANTTPSASPNKTLTPLRNRNE